MRRYSWGIECSHSKPDPPIKTGKLCKVVFSEIYQPFLPETALSNPPTDDCMMKCGGP
jgi:hypothetical protein